MEQLAYSSTAAFLAHFRILRDTVDRRGGDVLSPQDRETLGLMHQVLEPLTPDERAVLLVDTSDNQPGASGQERRRQERARLKLRRLLLTREIVRS